MLQQCHVAACKATIKNTHRIAGDLINFTGDSKSMVNGDDDDIVVHLDTKTRTKTATTQPRVNNIKAHVTKNIIMYMRKCKLFIPVFHSSVPFHHSIPPILDSQEIKMVTHTFYKQ